MLVEMRSFVFVSVFGAHSKHALSTETLSILPDMGVKSQPFAVAHMCYTHSNRLKKHSLFPFISMAKFLLVAPTPSPARYTHRSMYPPLAVEVLTLLF